MSTLFRLFITGLFFSLSTSAVATISTPSKAEALSTIDPMMDPMMQMGKILLTDAEQMEMESVGMIQHGNNLRKKIAKLRVKQRKLTDGKEKEALLNTINDYSQEIPKWQDKAGRIRAYGQSLHNNGIAVITDAFHKRWENHINLVGPMVTEDNKDKLLSHNSPIRSMHPTMLGKMQEMETEKKEAMTISTPGMMGQDIPPGLNIETFQISRDKNVFAHIEPLTIEDENDLPLVPLNKIHKWKLILSDLDGKPLTGAKIEIVGHMPGHVHGLPTQPQVTADLGEGLYEVDGVKFQMRGWWVMTFQVEAGDYQDEVTFNIKL